MKKIGCGLMIIFAVLTISIFERITQDFTNFEEVVPSIFEEDRAVEEETEKPVDFTHTPLHKFIGEDVAMVESVFSSPSRIDRSAYDYDWWIYPINHEMYLQFGILDEKVVTIYATGSQISSDPFEIGSDYMRIQNVANFNDEVHSTGLRFFKFELTKEELESKPLVYYEGVWIQLYFDTFTKKLSSIRYLDEETLLKQRPYSITYRGTLPDARPLSDAEWKKVEEGVAKQILDITNMIRYRHGLPLLKWHADAAKVAYQHSKDMAINNYFSHSSPTNGELKDRLLNNDVQFILAGENIASNYVDAPSVVEGWLNSEGHRVNLLNEEFTHLGIGVYEKFYTQNFITPFEL